MDFRRFVNDSSLIYTSCNQTKDCVVFGTNTGFYVYTLKPNFKKIIARKIPGGVSIVEMLSKSNSKWFSDNELVGYNLSSAMGKLMIENGGPANSEANKNILIKDMECDKAHYLWEILNRVPKSLSEEVTNLVPNHNNLVNKNSIYMFGKDKIYISKTANIEPLTVLNAENGPIIIKDNVQIKSFTLLGIR